MAYRLFAASLYCSVQHFPAKTNKQRLHVASTTKLLVQTLHNGASKASRSLQHWRACPEENTVLFAETATSVSFCEPSNAQNRRTGTRGARREAAIFRASGDGYAKVWAQQVRHADGGALWGARRERRTARAIFKAAIHVIGKVGPDAASFFARAEMEGWGEKKSKTSSVDGREQWIFEKWRCDKRDGLSAMKHLACKRRSAGFYTLRCCFIPTASCLHRRTVGCVQTIKRLSLSTPECHTWPHRFGVDDWGCQRGNVASDSTSYTAAASTLRPGFSENMA